jgi:hypothetical protein
VVNAAGLHDVDWAATSDGSVTIGPEAGTRIVSIRIVRESRGSARSSLCQTRKPFGVRPSAALARDFEELFRLLNFPRMYSAMSD